MYYYHDSFRYLAVESVLRLGIREDNVRLWIYTK